MSSQYSAGLVACVAAVAAIGCAPVLGQFDDKGFVHGKYPYTVEYTDAQARTFISTDWHILNFHDVRGKLVPKTGDDYETTFRLDTDGDGKSDSNEHTFVYDLELEHARRDQQIWLRTLPLSAKDRDKNLDVIARYYLDGIAGSGFAVVSLSEGSVSIVEKRFAIQTLGARTLPVAQRDGYAVVIDVANVDQLSMNTTDRRQRVALVFVRTGYKLYRTFGPNHDDAEFPILLVAGYTGSPADFDEGLPAFEQLLSKVALHGALPHPAPSKLPPVRDTAGIAATLPPGLLAALAHPVAPVITPAATPTAAPAAATTPAATVAPEASSAAPLAAPPP